MTAPDLSPLPRVGSRSVRRARALIHDRSVENLSLCELAAAAGISREQLVRSFHKSVGMPPHKYLLHVRVEKAKTLLESGSSVTAVAFEVGFYDQSHLTRWFKRFVGTTPAAYARHRASQPFAG